MKDKKAVKQVVDFKERLVNFSRLNLKIFDNLDTYLLTIYRNNS